MAYWIAINRPVRIYIPPRKQISPNTYTYYRAAMRGNDVDPSVLQWAICRQSPSGPPSPAPAGSPSPAPPVVLQPDTAYFDHYALATLAERKAFLKPHILRLKNARKGLLLRRLTPRSRSGMPSQQAAADMFILCDLLVLDGQIHELHRDWNGALSCYVDSLKVAADLSHGGGRDYQDNSAFKQSEAARNMWPVLPHVSTAVARAAARRISSIIRELPSEVDVLREEKYIAMAEQFRWIEDSCWREHYAKSYRECNCGADHRADIAKCYTVSKAWMVATCGMCFDRMIQEARRPYRPPSSKRPPYNSLSRIWYTESGPGRAK